MIEVSKCLIFEKEVFLIGDIVYITYDAHTNQKTSDLIRGKIDYIDTISIRLDCSREFESKIKMLCIKDIEEIKRCK